MHVGSRSQFLVLFFGIGIGFGFAFLKTGAAPPQWRTTHIHPPLLTPAA
jgi:hypothetical protein